MASDGLVVATPGKPHTLDTIPIEGRILPKGSDIIKEINRIKRQDELLEKQAVSILETNEISKQVGFSSINTNANIRETNISIQSLNTWLKYANFLSLCIAALTGLYIVKEFYKDASPNLQPINIQLGRIARTQDSLLKVQKGIDSSLRSMVKNDSIYASPHRQK